MSGPWKTKSLKVKQVLCSERRIRLTLASKIEEYFKSELFRNLETNRFQIKEYANERYLWSKVAPITTLVYASL
jgi:hypothetical protein